jgi:hypothetical protein
MSNPAVGAEDFRLDRIVCCEAARTLTARSDSALSREVGVATEMILTRQSWWGPRGVRRRVIPEAGAPDRRLLSWEAVGQRLTVARAEPGVP